MDVSNVVAYRFNLCLFVPEVYWDYLFFVVPPSCRAELIWKNAHTRIHWTMRAHQSRGLSCHGDGGVWLTF